MKVWLYYRLSRDEDEELNSLMNQRKIIYDYAVSQGYEIVGESFDDNVSGMDSKTERDIAFIMGLTSQSSVRHRKRKAFDQLRNRLRDYI